MSIISFSDFHSVLFCKKDIFGKILRLFQNIFLKSSTERYVVYVNRLILIPVLFKLLA